MATIPADVPENAQECFPRLACRMMENETTPGELAGRRFMIDAVPATRAGGSLGAGAPGREDHGDVLLVDETVAIRVRVAGVRGEVVGQHDAQVPGIDLAIVVEIERAGRRGRGAVPDDVRDEDLSRSVVTEAL